MFLITATRSSAAHNADKTLSALTVSGLSSAPDVDALGHPRADNGSFG